MPYTNENIAAGLGRDDRYQIGLSDVDNNQVVEQGSTLNWPTDPTGSYVYYDCTVEMFLDSGIVVHNRLPQVSRTVDSLSSVDLDDNNIQLITNKGVNLTSNDQYRDIVQRMGHSRYWFRLWGKALRVGYQVPIPAIKKIGGVDAIPYDKNPQWAFNRIFPGGNYGGVILWHAEWSLWYTTITPPINNTFPAADPSGMSSIKTPIPSNLAPSFTQADPDAVTNSPGFQVDINKPTSGGTRSFTG